LPNLAFAVRYQPVDELCVTEPLQMLGRDWRRFTFIDLGAGKGRALIASAPFDFKSLVGVEFVPTLVETARKNLAKVGLSNSVIICDDASAYRCPPCDLVVFYNPFAAELMRTVVDNLRADARGELCGIYVRPMHVAVLRVCGFLEPVFSRPNLTVWKSKAAPGP